MLHVHRAERADGLADALSALLVDPLPDPLASEVVVVPTRGMERWLAQRLASRLGICANVDFVPARRLVADVVAAAVGVDPDEDPWSSERAVWPLLEVIDAGLSEPWATQLAAHLDGHPARRFGVARDAAQRFARYELHRPELIGAWADGEGDGWQAELWRRGRARIGSDSPAQRLATACAALESDPALVELPARVALFGLTRLPAGRLRILRALAAARDVHLFLLHPSPALWDALAGVRPALRRREDVTATIPTHRLLASWGRDAREMQLVLAGAAHVETHHTSSRPDANADSDSDSDLGAPLLHRLQADVAADRAPRPRALTPADRSIRIHACHGHARQVEILRDEILHLLAEDESLEPRDVIVMCPDIEAFAPLIQATFGAGEVSDDDDYGDDTLAPELRPPDLRVRLADRALRQTNPLLGVVARLLELADERLTASQVLDFCDRSPVRRRFGFDDDAIERIEQWVADSGIRWGFDAAHRRAYRLEALDAGTWRKGLDRLLLGVTMTEDEQRRFADTVLPLDDVDSSVIELAGRLAELLDRLEAALASFAGRRRLPGWLEALAGAADALTLASPSDAWQRFELQRLLHDVSSEAGDHDAKLSLAELRGLLSDRLQGRPTRANFRTGHLTICTLQPMRAVPHRVVCLLGLDDVAFPRRAPRDGDDLMLSDPHVGERDARAEDRQMLLDALMSASERLVITYSGNDERTNAPRPPAVPVDELLEVIERTAGPSARDQVLIRHPLQPFDRRNFRAGDPWSFDRVTLAGARALGGIRTPAEPFLPDPLPELRSPAIELGDLVAFVEHPVRAFLSQRLGLFLRSSDDEIADELPVELDALAKWRVGERLLQARLHGVDRRSAGLAEIARGTLPPGHLGRPIVDEVYPLVDAIAAEVERLVDHSAVAVSVEVRVELPDGRVLTGSVAGVLGDAVRGVAYARLAPRHRLATWVRLLALTVAHPERPFDAVTVGRGERGVAVSRLPRIEPVDALAQLTDLVALFDAGLREPLPLYSATSAAQAAGGDPAAAWESDWDQAKEDSEPEHRLVLGGTLPFSAIRSEARFDSCARQLWDGLARHEHFDDS